VAKKQQQNKLRIIPLGGLEEIGKNMTVVEYGNDIMLIDCGLAFPDDDMFGVDLVIPDITYLKKNIDKVRGIVLTHGHEDHIGALPYFLKEINVPVYGTRLTLGLVENKLKEHNLLSKVKLNRISQNDVIKLGVFSIEIIHTNHSIADAVALAIHTPLGVVVHTGDFKIDTTPIDGDMIDLAKFGQLGKEGVLLLMSDSTNVERPGYAMSERKVGEKFNEIFKGCTKRILVATFASNVHRVQQIIDAAVKCGRKVALSGRSMENIVKVAILLGYMRIPEGALISIDEIGKYKPSNIVIVTTGSQGEPMSALSRIAFSDHKKVELTSDDLVIISASPIPGNEKTISNVINEIFKKGAEVIYESLAEVHVSGHACEEELKMILALTKPKYFVPVHGEYRHLSRHAKLGERMGVDPRNIFIMNIGQVLEFDEKKARIASSVPSGRILVDGLGVGDVGNIVLRDRKHLAEDGLIILAVSISAKTKQIVTGPDLVSRGFVYVREAEGMMDELRDVAKDCLDKCRANNTNDWSTIKTNLKNALSDRINQKTGRNPMILPIIMEV
jgi:ribonuclease J